MVRVKAEFLFSQLGGLEASNASEGVDAELHAVKGNLGSNGYQFVIGLDLMRFAKIYYGEED